MCEYDESLVQVLPKIGQPMEYKTWKNGRRKNKTETEADGATDYARTRKVAHGDMLNADKAYLTALNIKKHPKATVKQKYVADRLIEQYEEKRLELSWVSKVYAIAKVLNRCS